MNYLRSLGFYFCEWVGSTLNFLCSLVGFYPLYDLGVRYLFYFEAKRITEEQFGRQVERKQQESQADNLKNKAHDNG